MKKAALVVGFFLLLTCSVSADVSVVILKGEAVGDKKAALSVSAVDESGRPVRGLTSGNFELFVGGEKVDNFVLEPTSTTEEPLSVILGVDVSGSMWGTPFKETQKAISIFLDQLEKADFVSLMSFGTEVGFVADFTRERYVIRSQVEALRPVDDWTRLYDATYEAIRKGKDAPTTRAAVILLTDGRDEGSERNRKDAIELATGASVPVFTIGIGENIDSEFLQEIGQVSGGDFVSTPEPGNISVLYQSVLEQLKHQYLIQFDFTREPSTYKAVLTLVHGNETARSSKEFLFNPTGATIIVPPQATKPLEMPEKPWHVSLTSRQLMILGAALLGGFVVLIVLLTFVYFKVRRRRVEREKTEREERESRDNRLMEMLESGGSRECELEYPTEHHTAVQALDTRSSQMTRIAPTSSDVLLQIDGMKRSVPLVHEGVEVLEELIVAKKSKERASFRKPGAVYLWTKNDYVTRPSKERFGHARIFLGEGERFMIEDLGSTNGTWIGGKKIDGVFPLQDGDALDVGGKEGVRIVYKEGRQDLKEVEQTMISR